VSGRDCGGDAPHGPLLSSASADRTEDEDDDEDD
jgi:hypothetical protein